jgi:hypothetical protein
MEFNLNYALFICIFLIVLFFVYTYIAAKDAFTPRPIFGIYPNLSPQSRKNYPTAAEMP